MVLLLPAALLLALPAGQDADTQTEEVTITGGLPRCRALIRGDPLEQVDVSMGSWSQDMIRPDPKGVMRLMSDNELITGPEVWQRAGRYIQDYVFRPPHDGAPMCIGSMKRNARGFAQYRRILDAEPYIGKYLRFSAMVATRKSHEVRFWFAAGTKNGMGRPLQGGDTANQPLIGTHGDWIPVRFELGPIPKNAHHISYGFLLNGPGVVWVGDVKMEVVSEDELDRKAAPLNDVVGVPPRNRVPK